MGDGLFTDLPIGKEVNMEQNYIRKIIRKNTWRPMFISLIFVIIFLAGFLSESDKWSTLFTPLAEGTSVTGIQDLYAKDKYYFQLKNADIYFLDYAIYSYDTVNGVKTSEEKLSQVYGIIYYDDGYLLALLPKDYLDMTDEELSSVTAVADLQALGDDDYHQEAYDEMVSSLSEAYNADPSSVRESIPKICVTVTEHGRQGDQFLFLIMGLLLLVSASVFLYQLLVLINYHFSGFYKKLGKTGNAEDIEYRINRIVADETYLYKSSVRAATYTGLISSNYIIGMVKNSLALYPTKDLIWAHLNTIRHKSHFITIGKTYQILFYFKDVKTPVSINFPKEDMAAGLIQTLADNLSVMCGYSDELMKIYKKDYPAFLKLALQSKSESSQAEDGDYTDNSYHTPDQE